MNDQPKSEYPQVIGQNVQSLLSHLDRHIQDPEFREGLKESLRQLADVKFALDESSIVAVTDRKGKILYVNDKFCEISKYSREELLGKDHRIINSGYHSKSFMKELWGTITSGGVWRGEIRNKAKDGTYYWMNTTIVPILDETDNPYQFLAIRSEVTKLKHVEEELQVMMDQMLHIQEEERRRFSRELHDGIGQSLFSLAIRLDRLLAENEEQQELKQLRQDVTHIIEDVRGLAWELRPSVLDDLGVVPAIRTYIDNYSRHYGIRVHLDGRLRRRLGVRAETTIYRIIQEALTNIAKYAGVSEAYVHLVEKDEEIEIRVEDRGKGFVRSRDTKGVGLFSMEERARGVGGQLTVDSEAGVGTCIKLLLPVSKLSDPNTEINGTA